MKVMLEARTPERVKEKIEGMGYETVRLPKNWRETKPDFSDVDIAIGSQNLKHLPWKELKNIRHVFLKSVGIDYLPLDIFQENGVVLTNNRGAYSLPIGEFIVYNMLQMAKKNRIFIENKEKKVWDQTPKMETLAGKNVLFLGTGTIAKEAVKRLAPFETENYGYNRSGRQVPEFKGIYTEETLDEGIGNADYIVFCLPGTEETDRFFNEEFLKKVKPGVRIVNISRGSVIDEEVLIRGLKEGIIDAAALDVFEKEPLPETSELWELDNVYLTPHLSYDSEENTERAYSVILNNLESLKEGKSLENVVDYDKGY